MRGYRVTRSGSVLFIWLMALIGAGLDDARAQDKNQGTDQDEPKLGWSNETDLSLVAAAGNSHSLTLGVSDQFDYVWMRARFEFDLDAVRSKKADDRFFLVDPGLDFPVGGAPSSPATSLITPESKLDVANYLIRGSYERKISAKWFWNTGASWYRNKDAGIRNRYILFAGVGNTWADSQRRRLVTSYGISYTDREEDHPDPEKDRRFPGARAGWNYRENFNASTKFDSEFGINTNFADATDYSFSTINAMTVSVNTHISIKVSIQWLFENEPALETDLDVIAYVEVLNPDGIPGTGDERFRTVSSGGTQILLGSADARKEKLDTIIKTALAITF